MKERLFSIINIRVSESRTVFDLLAIQLFIGIAHSLINIVAFTLFIYQFSIQRLPFVYISIAAVLLLVNLVYERVEHRLSPLRLLRIITAFSAAVLLALWAGLLAHDAYPLVFLLLVWSTLFYMISGYAFWGLTSLLFNVRESKRVFSIVGAGDIPAKLIGYLSAPLLIGLLGLEHVLLVAVGALLMAALLLQRHARRPEWRARFQRQHAHGAALPLRAEIKGLVRFFFSNKLIFTISLLSLLSYNVFILIDYTFILQIKLRLHGLENVAAFVATFFAIGRFVALLLKVAVTSRVIERLGVISCLLITPAILMLFCAVFLAQPSSSGNALYVFGAMALISELLRSTMQEPTFFILFQPLSEPQRLRGHLIAKGYMLSPSLIIVGLSLIVWASMGVQLTLALTIRILMVNLLVWGGMVLYVKRAYVKTLRSSIARGVFNSEDVNVRDAGIIGMLVDKVRSGAVIEQIYALKLLEKAAYPDVDRLLEEALGPGSPELRLFALQRLEERGRLRRDLLNGLLHPGEDISVRERAVALLCRHFPEYLDVAAAGLAQEEFRIRKVLIVQLLNQPEFTYLYQAGSAVHSMIASPDPAERVMALDIMTELRNLAFTRAVEDLIRDPDAGVRRAAVIAACRLRIRKLLPHLATLLRQPAEKHLVLQGLLHYGDALFEDLALLPAAQVQECAAELIRTAGKVKGPHSTAFLLRRLDQHAPESEKLVEALWKKKYRAERPSEMQRLRQLLQRVLQKGAEKVHCRQSLPQFADRRLLEGALEAEIKADLRTALRICTLLYRQGEVDRVLELIENDKKEKLYNAMEMLELLLPQKISAQLNFLLDHLLDPTYSRRPLVGLDAASVYRKIVVAEPDSFNVWTRSICIYCLARGGQFPESGGWGRVNGRQEHFVEAETRNYVLGTL